MGPAMGPPAISVVTMTPWAALMAGPTWACTQATSDWSSMARISPTVMPPGAVTSGSGSGSGAGSSAGATASTACARAASSSVMQARSSGAASAGMGKSGPDVAAKTPPTQAAVPALRPISAASSAVATRAPFSAETQPKMGPAMGPPAISVVTMTPWAALMAGPT